MATVSFKLPSHMALGNSVTPRNVTTISFRLDCADHESSRKITEYQQLKIMRFIYLTDNYRYLFNLDHVTDEIFQSRSGT